MSQYINGEQELDGEGDQRSTRKSQISCSGGADNVHLNDNTDSIIKISEQQHHIDGETNIENHKQANQESENGVKLSARSTTSSTKIQVQIAISQQSSTQNGQINNQNYSEKQDCSPASAMQMSQKQKSISREDSQSNHNSLSSPKSISTSQRIEQNGQIVAAAAAADNVIHSQDESNGVQQLNENCNGDTVEHVNNENQLSQTNQLVQRQKSDEVNPLLNSASSPNSQRGQQKKAGELLNQQSQQQQPQKEEAQQVQLVNQEQHNPYENRQDEVKEPDVERVKKSKHPNNRKSDEDLNALIQAKRGPNANGDFAQGISLEIYNLVDKISEDMKKQKETNQYLYEEMKELQYQNSQRSGDRTSRLSSYSNQSPKEIKSMEITKADPQIKAQSGVQQQQQQSQQQKKQSTDPVHQQQQVNDHSNQQQQQQHLPNDQINKSSPNRQTFSANMKQSNTIEQQGRKQTQNPNNKQREEAPNHQVQSPQQQSQLLHPQMGQQYPNSGQYMLTNSHNLTQSSNFDSSQRIGTQQLQQSANGNSSFNLYNYYNGVNYDVEKLIQKLVFLQKENETLNKENALLREKNEYYQQRLQQIENDNRNQYQLASQLNNMYNFSSASSSNGSAVQLNAINGSYNQFATPLSDTNKKNISSPVEAHYFLSASRTNQNDNSVGSSQSLDSNLIKKLCEILCVESPDQLISVAKKYEKCIQSIPKLEQFITSVYQLVLPEQAAKQKNLAPMKEVLRELNIWKEERGVLKSREIGATLSQSNKHVTLHQSQSQPYPAIYNSHTSFSPRIQNQVSSNNYRDSINTFIQVFQIDESKEDIIQKLYIIRNQNEDYKKFIRKIQKTLELDSQIRDDLVLKITYDKLQQYPIYRKFTKSLQKRSGITDLNTLYSQLERMIAIMQNKSSYTNKQI